MVRKDYTAAETHYLGVIQLQPNNAFALNNLAWVGRQLHRDNAIAYAEKANQLVPNQPALMDTWAMLLSEKGQHIKAIELQSKALLAQPANTGFRLNLAKVYLAAGEKAKARLELDALSKQGATASENAEVASLLKNL